MEGKFLFACAMLVLMVVATGCPDREDFNPDSTITIKNNSGSNLLFNFVFRRFPDTSLVGGGSPFIDTRQYELALLKANSSIELKDEWIRGFQKDTIPIMVFLFSQDTVDKVPWEQIRNEYKILRRFDLTKAKLDSLDWTLTYP